MVSFNSTLSMALWEYLLALMILKKLPQGEGRISRLIVV